ncbi:MAG: TetR/AcrR family transcriptional regulator [Burkholderiaceae bacterium]
MSSSIDSKRPYHHGNLRQALLDAALRLLADVPAARMSLRELARAAQVSHAAPYHYFRDRDDLLHAAGVEGMRRLVQAQADAVHGSDTPRGRLLALGLAYVRFATREPHTFALVFDPQYCRPGEPSQDMAPLIADNEALLADCVCQAQKAGLLPAGDSGAIATALWGTVHGLAQLVMAGHIPLPGAEAALDALLPPTSHPQ